MSIERLLAGSLDIRLAIAADYANSERSQTSWIVGFDDFDGWQQRVVRTDMRCIFGGLFNSFHFLLATSVIEWTYNDRLSKEDVTGG